MNHAPTFEKSTLDAALKDVSSALPSSVVTPTQAQRSLMALKRLSTEEMLHVSGGWIDPTSDAHAAILASADLAPSLPRLKTAHDELAAAAQPAPQNKRLAEVSSEQVAIDLRHDDIIRGCYWLLTGTAHLLGTEDEDGAVWLELRDRLVPDGLSSTQKTYGAEAGQAAQLATRMTPAMRARTDAILVGTKATKATLTEFIEEWIHLGKQLGELDDEKARLTAALDRNGNATTVSPTLTARNKWIRNVNVLVAVAEAAELPASTMKLLFGPLQAAEAKADQRARAAARTESTPG